MKNSRQKVNEEESDHCAIDTNDIVDIDLIVPNYEANSNNKDEVNDFRQAYEPLLWLLNTYNIEKPLPNWEFMYLLINKN